MLVRLVVVRQQVVDGLKEGCQCPAVVLFFHKELLFGEDLNEVDQTIAGFAAQFLCVGCQVRDHSDD